MKKVVINHNKVLYRPYIHHVVINHKTTKFESNSQRIQASLIPDWGCYQSQNYKIWKQFTTLMIWWIMVKQLLSITKLQNLKAIHNETSLPHWKWIVVINHKTTKFESNSQQLLYSFLNFRCCYQSQNYKIWKQFTTVEVLLRYK